MTGPGGSVDWPNGLVAVEQYDRSLTPPPWAAWGSLCAGVTGSVLALFMHGADGFLGWTLGFTAIVLGIVYRAEVRARQMKPNFSPRRSLDRVMFLGVAFGFVGIVANALVIAQRKSL